MGIVLLVSIVIGSRLGDRVLGQQIGHQVPIAGTIPTPKPEPSDSGFNDAYWKRVKIVSVATDPGFPDPRVTPTPEPTRASPPPRPTDSPRPPSATPTPNADYTSPPLPIPLSSSSPDPGTGSPTPPSKGPEGPTPPP